MQACQVLFAGASEDGLGGAQACLCADLRCCCAGCFGFPRFQLPFALIWFCCPIQTAPVPVWIGITAIAPILFLIPHIVVALPIHFSSPTHDDHLPVSQSVNQSVKKLAAWTDRRSSRPPSHSFMLDCLSPLSCPLFPCDNCYI
jgi:hypothetical protein